MYWKGGGFTVRYELTTMWGKMQFLGAFAKLLNVKLVVHIVTSGV